MCYGTKDKINLWSNIFMHKQGNLDGKPFLIHLLMDSIIIMISIEF